jgi:hypothetical protein
MGEPLKNHEQLNQELKNQEQFQHIIRTLEAQMANVGTHLSIDAAARYQYSVQIQAMAAQWHAQASAGRISWRQAAEEAQQMRNVIMEILRARSTPVGLAFAQKIKAEGKTLNTLIAEKVLAKHGKNVVFSQLSAAQKDAVYAAIVESAGKSDPKITSLMRRLSPAGKGLIVISIGLSVYSIATAEDKVSAAGQELASTGAGVLGGVAGGALAGLACGPGAPVCVTVGAFVGGALAAFGVSYVW